MERVQFLNELLKKSGQVDFWIDKELYEFYNLEEIVDKLKKQYGLIVKVHVLLDKFHVIVKAIGSDLK